MASVLSSNFLTAQDSSSPKPTERRFLGTGTKVEKTECYEGTRTVKTTVTVLWIQIGEPTMTTEAC